MEDMKKTIQHAALALKVVVASGISDTVVAQLEAHIAARGMDGASAIFMQALRENVPNIRSQIAAMYAETFTTEELQVVLDHHGNPHAKSFLKKSVQLEPKCMTLMGDVMKTVCDRADELVRTLHRPTP